MHITLEVDGLLLQALAEDSIKQDTTIRELVKKVLSEKYAKAEQIERELEGNENTEVSLTLAQIVGFKVNGSDAPRRVAQVYKNKYGISPPIDSTGCYLYPKSFWDLALEVTYLLDRATYTKALSHPTWGSSVEVLSSLDRTYLTECRRCTIKYKVKG